MEERGGRGRKEGEENERERKRIGRERKGRDLICMIFFRFVVRITFITCFTTTLRIINSKTPSSSPAMTTSMLSLFEKVMCRVDRYYQEEELSSITTFTLHKYSSFDLAVDVSFYSRTQSNAESLL